MANRLRVTLPRNWRDCSHENPHGSPIYKRAETTADNVLQVSCAWYKGGAEPKPTDDILIHLSERAFEKVPGVHLLSTGSGACVIGRFGTAVSESPHFLRLQSWHLSNGLDFVMVTYICKEYPDPDELAEAAQIVSQLAIIRR